MVERIKASMHASGEQILTEHLGMIVQTQQFLSFLILKRGPTATNPESQKCSCSLQRNLGRTKKDEFMITCLTLQKLPNPPQKLEKLVPFLPQWKLTHRIEIQTTSSFKGFAGREENV